MDKPKPAAGGGGDQVLESLSATLPKYRAPIHVGDRVKDRHSGRLGTCLYVGPAEFAKGKEVCGVRLDKARTTTDCDGKYRGERHFRCTSGHGLYIPLEDAEFVGIADDDDYAPPRGGGGGNELRRDNVPAAAKERPRRASQGAGTDADATGGEGELASAFDLDAELDKIIGLDAVKDMLLAPTLTPTPTLPLTLPLPPTRSRTCCGRYATACR